jgi:predicted double-glycine peptidase
MTEVVEGFKSEVTTDGGYYQRIQDREAHKEKMRLKKEEEKAQAAENTIRLQQAREESRKQAAMLAEAKRLAQITAEKPAPVIMPAPVAVSAPKVEPVPKAAQPPASQKTQKAEQVDAKKATETRDVETLKTTQGAVHVPAELPPSSLNTALKKETGPLVNVAQDLGAIMPAPAELTVGQEPEVPVVVESGKRLIERLLGAGTASPATTADDEPELEVKSKRGVERIQKIMQEKRTLEKQVEEMQVTILGLQDVVRKYEIESRLVENVMNTTEGQKSKPELISQARTTMMEYLQSRNNEIDHAAKVECFNKYLADPFYMQIFVQNNKPEDWQSTIEFIYNAIEMTNIPIRPTRLSFLKGAQPIRARTATLGTPLMTADNPIERITQHLGNMGI